MRRGEERDGMGLGGHEEGEGCGKRVDSNALTKNVLACYVLPEWGGIKAGRGVEGRMFGASEVHRAFLFTPAAHHCCSPVLSDHCCQPLL